MMASGGDDRTVKIWKQNRTLYKHYTGLAVLLKAIVALHASMQWLLALTLKLLPQPVPTRRQFSGIEISL
ncbi:hypothetical protein [Tolypothrix bouteillei]